jgi:nucleoside-diphosphate-sugar epimerase
MTDTARPSLGRRLVLALKPFAQFGVDALVAGAALWLAALVRYEFAVPAPYARLIWTLLPAVVLAKPLLNFVFGSYRQMWMYTSARESGAVVVSAGIVAVGLLALRLAGVEFEQTPRGPIVVPYSIVLLDAMFYVLGAVGVRMLRRQQVAIMRKRGFYGSEMRTLVLGAGNTASALLLDATRGGGAGPFVGLLDDDPAKRGRRLHGVPVLGATTSLERVVRETGAERVVVAMPSADPVVLRDLIRRAESSGAVVRVVAGLRDALAGERPDVPVAPTLADLVDADEVKRTLLGRVAGDRSKRVLVTGGAGYIGNFLVRRLLDAGYTVRVLDNLSFGGGALREFMERDGFELLEGDISSLRDVARAVKDVGTVVALAAVVGDPACGVDAEETLTLNFESTKAITEACSFYGVDRLVFASSCSVYGASEGDQLLDETSPLNPVSLYARTRILSENVVFERCGSTTPVVLRLATVFGLSPRMRFDLVVNALTVRGVVDGRFQIFGGDQWRPFVHCADVAEAFFLAATAPRERVAGQVFNVGSDAMNFTIAQAGAVVAAEIDAAGAGPVDAQSIESTDDARNYRVTFAKIRSVLGFEPRYDLPTGIREMVEAIRSDSRLREYRGAEFSNLEVMRQRIFGPEASGDGARRPVGVPEPVAPTGGPA